MKFSVWAPNAERSVELLIEGERLAMTPANSASASTSSTTTSDPAATTSASSVRTSPNATARPGAKR